MTDRAILSLKATTRDLTAGLVVFLVALPLCLGVALASNAPLFSGVVAGIVGGILVGLLSGSHVSVSGPAAGLTVVVAAQIASLGSFSAFLLALIVAGLIQIVLGLLRAGFIAAFFPSSTIKGLLAAIGVILILKQIPHLLGHDTDPDGEMAFFQPDHENTFSEFLMLFNDFHLGAAVIGVASIVVLLIWDKPTWLALRFIPAPLAVVALGVALARWFQELGGRWLIDAKHLVQVPEAGNSADLMGFLTSPDYSQWLNPAVYSAGLTIALIASLETLVNLQGVDNLDPEQRGSKPSRELLAQGVGNVVSGLLGGLPITSVIVRSSVNINAGARTKLATVFHGLLLLICVALLPAWINMIPLSSLAAILLVTGFKLVSPKLLKQMWSSGHTQFIPFALTVVAIVFTDLVTGVLVGLAVSIGFILNSNLRHPASQFIEKHLDSDVLHIKLPNQVSFLNRAALQNILSEIPRGEHVLIDAHNTDYIDPDVLDLIRDFQKKTAVARGVKVSLRGFAPKYNLPDQIQFVEHSSRELQSRLTPCRVLQILKDGNERFRTGHRLKRDSERQFAATADRQYPLAVILSCIDSRTPAELIFDLGVGDIFGVRIAGNTSSPKVLGSLEYACAVAGAKLLLVLGHSRCGAVTEAVARMGAKEPIIEPPKCEHIAHILRDVQKVCDVESCQGFGDWPLNQQQEFVDDIARANVIRTVRVILAESTSLATLARNGKIFVVGALYDVASGKITFLYQFPSNIPNNDIQFHFQPPETNAPPLEEDFQITSVRSTHQ